MSLLAVVVSYRNSTSNHNRLDRRRVRSVVVSYRNSTSNHNSRAAGTISAGLYLIEILHQTTTTSLIQMLWIRCILSKFYIKPQRWWSIPLFLLVVSYRNSTSNHNRLADWRSRRLVVSYRNSTSNHNYGFNSFSSDAVVSYRNSTSNHNSEFAIK